MSSPDLKSSASPSPARGRPPLTTHETVTRVALELFATKGFEQTTVDDIAAAIGIGRRTLFRYFESKNDIVWGDFDWVLKRLEHDLGEQDPALPIIDAVSAAAISSNHYPDEQLPELRTRMALITTVPALQGHSMIRYTAWRNVIAEYAARRRGETPTAIWPQTLGFAALGASMAAFSTWVSDGGDLTAHLTDAYSALNHGFRDLPSR